MTYKKLFNTQLVTLLFFLINPLYSCFSKDNDNKLNSSQKSLDKDENDFNLSGKNNTIQGNKTNLGGKSSSDTTALASEFKSLMTSEVSNAIINIQNQNEKELKSGEWLNKDPDLKRGVVFFEELSSKTESIENYGIKKICDTIKLFNINLEENINKHQSSDQSLKNDLGEYIRALRSLKLILSIKNNEGELKYVGEGKAISTEDAEVLLGYIKNFFSIIQREVENKNPLANQVQHAPSSYSSIQNELTNQQKVKDRTKELILIQNEWEKFEKLKNGTWDTGGSLSFNKDEKKISYLMNNISKSFTYLQTAFADQKEKTDFSDIRNKEDYKNMKENFIEANKKLYEIIFKTKKYTDLRKNSEQYGLKYVGPKFLDKKQEGLEVEKVNNLLRYMHTIAVAIMYVESDGKIKMPLDSYFQLGPKDYINQEVLEKFDYKKGFFVLRFISEILYIINSILFMVLIF